MSLTNDLEFQVLDGPLLAPRRPTRPCFPRAAWVAHGQHQVQPALPVQAEEARLGDLDADGVERAVRTIDLDEPAGRALGGRRDGDAPRRRLDLGEQARPLDRQREYRLW